jgi:hypothetical protein
MTEPNAPRPVPGPPRPGPGPALASAPTEDTATEGTAAHDAAPETDRDAPTPFADLDERPVSDHVAVYEAEHSRLQRELGTIDQL